MKLEHSEIFLLVAALVKEARAKGLAPSETYIQKALYLLQEALDIDLKMEILPYIYGPYSLDSALLIGNAEVHRFIVTVDSGAYNVMDITPYGREMIKILDKKIVKLVKKLTNIFAKAHKKVKELLPNSTTEEVRIWELIASVHYIKKQDKIDDPKKIYEALLRWKPHFEGANVEEILKLLKKLEPRMKPTS